MLALAFVYIALMLLVGALICLGLPTAKNFNSTPARESIMYKTAYWLFMAMFVCFALAILCAAVRL